jgi:hypothetical protein
MPARFRRSLGSWMIALAIVGIGSEQTSIGRETLRSLTQQLVVGLRTAEPASVAQYFYLQASTCVFELGFSCAPPGAPPGTAFRTERPTIDRTDPASVARAAAAMREALWPPTRWLTTAMATPGAALATVGHVAGQGWPVWVSTIVVFAIAVALVSPMFEVSFAVLALVPFAAAAAAWLLSMLMGWLAGAGWPLQFFTFMTSAAAAFMKINDVAQGVEKIRKAAGLVPEQRAEVVGGRS